MKDKDHILNAIESIENAMRDIEFVIYRGTTKTPIFYDNIWDKLKHIKDMLKETLVIHIDELTNIVIPALKHSSRTCDGRICLSDHDSVILGALLREMCAHYHLYHYCYSHETNSTAIY